MLLADVNQGKSNIQEDIQNIQHCIQDFWLKIASDFD